MNDRIGQYLERKKEADTRLFGLDMKIESGSGESEIMDYFIRNKKLYLEEVCDTTMEFAVKDYITFFDEEMAKMAIDNDSSYIYRPERGMSTVIPPKDMKMLMTAVFIDQEIRMKVCAAYRFRLDGGVSALCLGGYEKQINTFLKSNDYIGAIEQCVASCKSLNFGDGAVMREFMKRLYKTSDYSSNVKCFELPDGRVVEPKEAIEYLKNSKGGAC